MQKKKPTAGKKRAAGGRPDASAGAPRRAAASLVRPEALYRALLDYLPLAVFAKDAEGRYTFVNPPFCEALGRSAPDVLGKTDHDLFHSDQAARHRDEDRRVLKSGAPLETREEIRRPDGSARAVRMVRMPLRDPQGRIAGVQGVLWAKGESGRPADAAAHPELSDRLMDAAPACIYFKDAHGRFLRVNRAAAALFGIDDPAKAVGKTDFDFYPRGEAERFRRDEEEILRTGVPLVGREEQGMRSDGRTTWHATTKMPLRDAEGRIAGIVGISYDITAFKQSAVASAGRAAQLDALLDAVPDPAWVKDAEGRYLWINRAGAARLGLDDPAKAAGRTDAEIRPGEEADRARAEEQEVLRSGAAVVGREERAADAAGGAAWYAVTRAPLRDAAGRTLGTLGLARDITARRRAEGEAAGQTVLLRALLDGVPDAVAVKDAGGRLIRINATQAARLGLADPAQAAGKNEADLLPRDEAEALLREEQEVLRSGNAVFGREEERLRPDGTAAWTSATWLPLRDAEGHVAGTVRITRDITELKRAQVRLVQHAFYDPLTGLPNRSLFMDRLDHLLRRTRRSPEALSAILFLDLDRFKGVNDSLGHHAGDELLFSVARRLERCLRPGDTIARLGGDEFVILLEDLLDVNAAVRVAKRILQEVAAPCVIAGTEVFTTISLGIALSSNRYERPDEMLRDADTAMYRAKAQGRARYEVFDTAMHERAVNLLQFETDLRHALERHEFALVYQPIVSLADGRLLGFEALLRWRHPRRGLLAPAEFLPFAEETGQIGAIGLWVLREASRQTRDWQKRFPSDPPLRVSVNLSSRQLVQKDFVDQIRRILEDTQLDPACLTLEITEGTIFESVKTTVAILERIRALSVQLHIEDFGSRVPAAGEAGKLPIHTLKVDRSFIGRMQGGAEQAEVVRAVVDLARRLGVDVTAEGVETPAQVEALRALKCASAQGFYFSEPLETAAAEALLAKGPRWT